MEKSRPLTTISGVGVGAGVVALSVVLGSFVRMVHPHASVSVVSAALSSIVLVVIAWRRPHVAAGAAVAVACTLVPLTMLGATLALSDPLVVMSFRCGNAMLGIPVLALILFVCSMTIAVPIALFANKIHRALVLVAAVAIVVSTVTSVLGVFSLRRPEPDAFLTLFTRSATLSPGGTVVLGSRTFTWDTNVTSAALMGERHCSLHASDGAERIEVVEGDVCPRLNLLHDEASDMVLVSIDGHGDNRVVAWFGQSASYGHDLGISDFRGRLGAPRAWVVGAIGGLLIAMLAFSRAIAARRRAKDVRAVEAAHVGAGWVKMSDAPPRHLPELAMQAPGPVVVLDATNASGATIPSYRDDGAPHELRVAVASRESLRAADYARAVAWSCVAIAAACASEAPLWASRLFGLL